MQFHQFEGYIQSIYLVESTAGLMLLDGCCRADVPVIRGFITQTLGRPFTDLNVVVVTHMHPDHAGAAVKLRKLTGCKIATCDKDREWYRGLDGLLMRWTEMGLTLFVAGRQGKPRRNVWYPNKLRADIRLRDGDAIPGFEEWRVLETPGHTDRDLSLHHVPSNRVYVADLMVKVKQRFIPPFPVFHPNKYRASLQKLENLKPASVWLAHAGEVTLSHDDYQHLLDSAPSRPITYAGYFRAKLKQMMRRYPLRRRTR